MLRDCAKSLKRSQSAFKRRKHPLESRRAQPPDDIVPTSLPHSSTHSSTHSSPSIASSPLKRALERAVGISTLAAAMIVAQGCAAASNAPASADARVIVRFRPGSPDPSDAAFRARLASSAHVSRVDLLHPMSGGAYVMTVGCADPSATTTTASNTADACASAIERLGATESVTSIEIDSREKQQ